VRENEEVKKETKKETNKQTKTSVPHKDEKNKKKAKEAVIREACGL